MVPGRVLVGFAAIVSVPGDLAVAAIIASPANPAAHEACEQVEVDLVVLCLILVLLEAQLRPLPDRSIDDRRDGNLTRATGDPFDLPPACSWVQFLCQHQP